MPGPLGPGPKRGRSQEGQDIASRTGLKREALESGQAGRTPGLGAVSNAEPASGQSRWG